MYLAAAGVGSIGIADGDLVELSNLQRQIAHSTADLGRSKAVSAAESMKAIAPTCRISTFEERIDENNIRPLIRDYDFVIDATDNFESKFLINDACVAEKKPFCHGAVSGFKGQLMTYVPGAGPCYRCVFNINIYSYSYILSVSSRTFLESECTGMTHLYIPLPPTSPENGCRGRSPDQSLIMESLLI